MYSVRKKNIAKKPANAISWVASAAASPLTRKIENGNSGLRLRRSLTTNAASSTAAAASSPIVCACAPADVGRPDQRVDEQQHPAGAQDRAASVEVGERGRAARRPASSRNAPTSDQRARPGG